MALLLALFGLVLVVNAVLLFLLIASSWERSSPKRESKRSFQYLSNMILAANGLVSDTSAHRADLYSERCWKPTV